MSPQNNLKREEMRFEFDSNQAYQRNAIDAVVKLFDGQSYVETDLTFGGESSFHCDT